MIHRPLFHLRQALGREPTVDPRIKVFALDDNSLTYFGTTEPDADAWADMLTALAKRKPRAILIDKSFAIVPADPKREGNLAKAFDAAPMVAVASYFTLGAVVGKEPYPMERSPLRQWMRSGDQLGTFAWLPLNPGTTYGPDAALRPHIAHVGHIVHEGDVWVRALNRPAPDAVMPHLALFGVDDWNVRDDGLYVADRRVPLDDRGALLVNVITPHQLGRSLRRLSEVAIAARAGLPVANVSEGDIVFILPAYYTGATDFVATPVGDLPGGLVPVSLTNELRTGVAFSYWDPGVAGIVVAAGVGFVAAATLPAMATGAAMLGVTLIVIGASIALFVVGNVVVWALWVNLAFLLAAAVVLISRAATAEIEARLLRRALATVVPAGQVQSFVRALTDGRFEPREQVVTLMFIDVVGFSHAVEMVTPLAAFRHLKELLGQLITIVQEHDGFVDRSLGDGLLCYFGYSLGEPTQDHADRALECATAIQRLCVARCAEGGDERPVFPLRIGINSGGVYIGNLGTTYRPDLTVIGHGVNMAQRFEAACDPFMVMIGAPTLPLMTRFSIAQREFQRRLVTVKHQKRPMEAFQFDPHVGRGPKVGVALENYRRFSGVQRLEQRWPVQRPELVAVTTDFEAAQLVDFSLSGFALRLSHFLSRGMLVNVKLSPASDAPPLSPVLSQLPTLVVEVRWGRAMDGGYLHGVLIRNLSANQLEELCESLKATVVTLQPSDAQPALKAG
jgi:class 3 adenylate cyclase